LSREAVQKTFLSKPEKGVWKILFSGLIFTGIISSLYIYKPLFFRFLDLKLYDLLISSNLQDKPSGLVAVVDLDEKSLARFGQWPWPRYRIAQLLEKIKALGALSVGLDMVFPEPDRTSLKVLQKELLQDLKIRIDLPDSPDQILDNDALFSRTLSQGPFVLGYKFLFSSPGPSSKKCTLTSIPVAVIGKAHTAADRPFLFRPKDAVCNLATLAEAAPLSGFFNISPDPDGIIRRAPLLMEYHGKFYPSLSLATLFQAFGPKQIILKTTPGGIESIQFGESSIPVDARGNLLIRYRGKGKTFPFIPAGDILLNSIPREKIQGKIVFLGTSAGGLGELRPTPVDTVFPGPEVQATIVDNLLRKDFYSRPYWISGLELFLVLAAGLSTTLLLCRTGAAWSLLPLGLLALGLWQSSRWLMHDKGLYLSCLFPLIMLGGNFSFLSFIKYWREEKRVRERTKELALTQDFTILCLAALTETRDSETGGHILRCQNYVKVLAQQLATHFKFCEILNPETINFLYKSSALHDIGKVGVPDAILLKHGRLTGEEFEEMKRHTLYGRQALQNAEDRFGSGVNGSFLQCGKEIAYTHHEKWDGTGYPDQLKGEEIPLFGRIMAIADVYDALVSKRVYKPPFSHEEAVSFISRQKGSSFDPLIVEIFLSVHEEFRKIALKFPDQED
jgi:CHASE2 domain-containing sensor protein